jgi:hypothetical protein
VGHGDGDAAVGPEQRQTVLVDAERAHGVECGEVLALLLGDVGLEAGACVAAIGPIRILVSSVWYGPE